MRAALSLAGPFLLVIHGATAHFTVEYPLPVGDFKDDSEDEGPCGGYEPNISETQMATDFHAEGDAVATRSNHPQSNWLYRITTDTDLTAATVNWTQVYPIVQQSGAGDFCVPTITIPSEFVGKKAILSTVASGLDGLLFQCSAINVVSGQNQQTPSACVNGSSITTAFVEDDALTALLGGNGGEGDGTSSGLATPSETPSLGVSMRVGPSFESIGILFLTVGAMTVLGAVLAI